MQVCTIHPNVYCKHCQKWHPWSCAGLVEDDLEPIPTFIASIFKSGTLVHVQGWWRMIWNRCS